MNSGGHRSLIHYFLVHNDIRFQNIGTAMLKMIMSQLEYVGRKIMSVKRLQHKCLSVVSMECTDFF